MSKRGGEIPINQHDLGITLSLFGYLNLRSLKRLNVTFSKQEIDDFMHMWKYVGFILGIKYELLPESLEDQEEFFLSSVKYAGDPSWIKEETKFVLDEMARKVNEDSYIVPQYLAQDALHQLTRYLSGNQYCTGMKIEDKGDDHWSINLFKTIGSFTTNFKNYLPYGETIMYNLNLRMIQNGVKQHEKKSGEKLGARVKQPTKQPIQISARL